MNTNESVVFAGLSTLIRNNVLTPIVNYCATKGHQYSIEELANVLKLAPTTPTAPIANMSMSSLTAPQLTNGFAPNLAPQGLNLNLPAQSFNAPLGFPPVANAPPTLTAFGGVAMPIPGAKKGRGKSTAPTAPVPDNERCQYIITRGRNKNTRCESRSESGQPFCGQCKVKKAANAQLQQGVAPPAGGTFPGLQGAFNGVPTVPGLQSFGVANMGMLPGALAPNATGTMNQLNPLISSSLTAPTQEPPKVQVIQLGNGMYHEKNHNLLIKINSPGEFICCGVMDPKTGNVTALTPDKIDVCKQLKMSYVDPTKSDGSTINPTTHLPMNSLPMNSLPSVSGQTLPSVNQQLPGVSSGTFLTPQVNMTLPSAVPAVSMTGLPLVNQQQPMQQFGLPQVPAMNGIGIGILQGAPAVTDHHSADDPNDDDDDDDEENDE